MVSLAEPQNRVACCLTQRSMENEKVKNGFGLPGDNSSVAVML